MALNALGIMLAGVGAGFGGGGLWVFTVMAIIFSVRSGSKRPNAPAAAAVLLIPVLLYDLNEIALGLFWSAFVLIAVLPFTYTPVSYSNGLRVTQQPSRVSLWTIWGEHTRTPLKNAASDPALNERVNSVSLPPASFTRVYSANTDAPCIALSGSGKLRGQQSRRTMTAPGPRNPLSESLADGPNATVQTMIDHGR
jgi:hypothetical protein